MIYVCPKCAYSQEVPWYWFRNRFEYLLRGDIRIDVPVVDGWCDACERISKGEMLWDYRLWQKANCGSPGGAAEEGTFYRSCAEQDERDYTEQIPGVGEGGRCLKCRSTKFHIGLVELKHPVCQVTFLQRREASGILVSRPAGFGIAILSPDGRTVGKANSMGYEWPEYLVRRQTRNAIIRGFQIPDSLRAAVIGGSIFMTRRYAANRFVEDFSPISHQ